MSKWAICDMKVEGGNLDYIQGKTQIYIFKIIYNYLFLTSKESDTFTTFSWLLFEIFNVVPLHSERGGRYLSSSHLEDSFSCIFCMKLSTILSESSPVIINSFSIFIDTYGHGVLKSIQNICIIHIKTKNVQGVQKKRGISVLGTFQGVKWPQIKKWKKINPP